MDIFVGNLPFAAAEDDVKKLFGEFGNVASAVIVMEKEKKAPKSRGFGFVNMPDEQQALAAIAALNGREFMGRPLNVNPARPQTKTLAISALQENSQLRAVPEARQRATVNRRGAHKIGRRAHSYMKRKGLEGLPVEVKPRRRSQDNPMRWRKKKDHVKPRKHPA